jgi:hypothetical protein
MAGLQYIVDTVKIGAPTVPIAIGTPGPMFQNATLKNNPDDPLELQFFLFYLLLHRMDRLYCFDH